MEEFREKHLDEDKEIICQTAEEIFKVHLDKYIQPNFDLYNRQIFELNDKIKIAETIQHQLETLHVEIKRAKYDKLDLAIEIKELNGKSK